LEFPAGSSGGLGVLPAEVPATPRGSTATEISLPAREEDIATPVSAPAPEIPLERELEEVPSRNPDREEVQTSRSQVQEQVQEPLEEQQGEEQQEQESKNWMQQALPRLSDNRKRSIITRLRALFREVPFSFAFFFSAFATPCP
jgi:hypothetical protein